MHKYSTRLVRATAWCLQCSMVFAVQHVQHETLLWPRAFTHSRPSCAGFALAYLHSASANLAGKMQWHLVTTGSRAAWKSLVAVCTVCWQRMPERGSRRGKRRSGPRTMQPTTTHTNHGALTWSTSNKKQAEATQAVDAILEWSSKKKEERFAIIISL